MARHHALACPNLSALRLDVDRSVLVTVNALVNKLALTRNAVILVRDRVAEMLNVELSVTPRCVFALVTLPVIHLFSAIPDQVSFEEKQLRRKYALRDFYYKLRLTYYFDN